VTCDNDVTILPAEVEGVYPGKSAAALHCCTHHFQKSIQQGWSWKIRYFVVDAVKTYVGLLENQKLNQGHRPYREYDFNFCSLVEKRRTDTTI
jgi:hypothetical protein